MNLDLIEYDAGLAGNGKDEWRGEKEILRGIPVNA